MEAEEETRLGMTLTGLETAAGRHTDFRQHGALCDPVCAAKSSLEGGPKSRMVAAVSVAR